MIVVLHAEASSVSLPEIMQSLHRMGVAYKIVIPGHVTVNSSVFLEMCDRLQTVEIVRSHADLLKTITGAEGICTFTDSLVPVVEGLRATIELERNGREVDIWDKLQQRQSLRRRGLSAIDVVRVDSVADLEAAAEIIGLPAVLKPRRGVGGGGITMLQNGDDLTRALASGDLSNYLLETQIPMHRGGDHPCWLAPFVSVETVSRGGEHYPLAVFDKLPVSVQRGKAPGEPDRVRVQGDIFPSTLSHSVRHDLELFVSRCLTALSLRVGVTHSEVALTDGGFEIIEINGRVGADLQRLLRASGVSIDLIHEHLAASIGRAVDPTPRSPERFSAGIYPDLRVGPPGPRDPTDLTSVPAVCGSGLMHDFGARPLVGRSGRLADVVVSAGDWSEICERIEEVLEGLPDPLATQDDLVRPLRAVAKSARGEPPFVEPEP